VTGADWSSANPWRFPAETLGPPIPEETYPKEIERPVPPQPRRSRRSDLATAQIMYFRGTDLVKQDPRGIPLGGATESFGVKLLGNFEVSEAW
jgi:hypothetical protein